MIDKISQSFLKTFRSYLEGETCGNIVHYQYVDGKFLDNASEAMKLGSYFEFMAFGSLPKDGRIPVAQYNKDGKNMTMEYKRATVNAERILATFNEIGFVVISAGKKLTKGRFEGVLDLIVELTKDWGEHKAGDKIVIDLKYSGLLYNYWETHGWGDERGWSDAQKRYHGTQAKQYHFISGLPFYFWVTGNTNMEKENPATGKKEFDPTDFKVMYVPIDQHQIDQHIEEGNKLFDRFKAEVAIGLVPLPSYKKCSKCPLFSQCEDKHTYPHPTIVDLTIGI